MPQGKQLQQYRGLPVFGIFLIFAHALTALVADEFPGFCNPVVMEFGVPVLAHFMVHHFPVTMALPDLHDNLSGLLLRSEAYCQKRGFPQDPKTPGETKLLSVQLNNWTCNHWTCNRVQWRPPHQVRAGSTYPLL